MTTTKDQRDHFTKLLVQAAEERMKRRLSEELQMPSGAAEPDCGHDSESCDAAYMARERDAWMERAEAAEARAERLRGAIDRAHAALALDGETAKTAAGSFNGKTVGAESPALEPASGHAGSSPAPAASPLPMAPECSMADCENPVTHQKRDRSFGLLNWCAEHAPHQAVRVVPENAADDLADLLTELERFIEEWRRGIRRPMFSPADVLRNNKLRLLVARYRGK